MAALIWRFVLLARTTGEIVHVCVCMCVEPLFATCIVQGDSGASVAGVFSSLVSERMRKGKRMESEAEDVWV